MLQVKWGKKHCLFDGHCGSHYIFLTAVIYRKVSGRRNATFLLVNLIKINRRNVIRSEVEDH